MKTENLYRSQSVRFNIFLILKTHLYWNNAGGFKIFTINQTLPPLLPGMRIEEKVDEVVEKREVLNVAGILKGMYERVVSRLIAARCSRLSCGMWEALAVWEWHYCG